jgi:hypothetical protein
MKNIARILLSIIRVIIVCPLAAEVPGQQRERESRVRPLLFRSEVCARQ